MSARYTFFTLLACSLAGCGQADPGSGKTSPPALTAIPVEVETQAAPHDLGAGQKPPPRRGVSRMRIDTLQASMTRVAGNDVYGNPIRWMYNNNDGFSDAAFGKALGRPDYLTSTDESAVPNALYLKFVGDAARDICTQMARNDQKRRDPATRALFPKAPIDGTATARSSATCTVHLPVPLDPALSSTASTNQPSLSGSLTPKILAVMSIKNDSSGPAFHPANTAASAGASRPPTRLSTS